MNPLQINNQVNEYYNKSTDAWIEIHGSNRIEGFSFFKNVEAHDLVLSSYFNFKEGEKILDAGCGVGNPSINFAKNNPYSNFYLVNINEYQLSKIKDIPENVYLFKCDFNNLIFPSNYFDKVYFLESFSHSLKKTKTIKEIYRVLKPNGKIFLLDFCRKQNIKLSKLHIHRKVYAHFPVFSKLLRKMFINRKFKENFFVENMQNNIFTPNQFDTNTFYCYDKDSNLTSFGEIHKEILENDAHVQYPIFCSYTK